MILTIDVPTFDPVVQIIVAHITAGETTLVVQEEGCQGSGKWSVWTTGRTILAARDLQGAPLTYESAVAEGRRLAAAAETRQLAHKLLNDSLDTIDEQP
jgi:hypothetical protein